MSPRPGMSRTALLAVFTLSGFSGLIYESIWSHYFKLFLGHSAYAQTLVLTVFMGGMALGAWLAARFSPRLRSLLLAYALVELLTGAMALVFHPTYIGVLGFTFDSLIPSLDSAAAINTAKWSVATLLILPQSILLGTTFPFISGGVVRRFPDRPGATLAMLYFTNSLGAAIGVLASGFWLIGALGLAGTVMAAGVVNLALGALVWVLRGDEPPAPVSRGDSTDSAANAETARLTRRILVAAFLAGAAAFVYEIAWIRMLSQVLGSSTHAFELMLSAFILGLAFGGLWIRKRIDSLVNPLGALALMFALMAVLATLTLPAYGFTFDAIAVAMRAFPATDGGYAGFNLVSHAIAAFVMIPTTFVAGMTLPLMTHTLMKRADERAIGRVYACNTMGAIAGVMLAVHVLVPGTGVKGAVLAGALLQLAIALLFAAKSYSKGGATRAARGVLAGAAALVILVAAFVQLDPMRMASGVYRKGQARLPEDWQVLLLKDGKTATISLARLGDVITIATNGKPDAAINMGNGDPSPDEITMTMAAALPLAIHAAARDFANIGIGSGLTSHVLLASPSVARLDSIEIEPAMAEAARVGFGTRVARLYEDPRSEIHFEDAKTFFSAARRSYDVIISEPSNPWISGVATLFSQEFYAQIKRHLKPDGLLVQWIQIYETDLSVVASIFKALSPHFSDYVVYSTDDANILIIAAPTGLVPGLVNDPFATPGLAGELRRSGLDNLGDIAIRRIGGKRLLDGLFATFDAPANSDFRPFVDLNAPRMRFLSRDALDLVRLQLLPVPMTEILGEPLEYAASTSPASAKYFTRHRMAIEAEGILRALENIDVNAAPEESRAALQVLLDNPLCATADERTEWLQAVYGFSSVTTPYLPPSRRAQAWQRIGQSRCVATVDATGKTWLDLLLATGTGDTAGIARNGLRVLQNAPATLNGAQMLETLLATACALDATGRGSEARELLEAYLPALQNAGQYTLALRMVLGKVSPAADAAATGNVAVSP